MQQSKQHRDAESLRALLYCFELAGIHPNYNGYSALLERTWTQYWSRFFPGKQPVGASALSNMTMATPPTETIGAIHRSAVLDRLDFFAARPRAGTTCFHWTANPS